MSNSTKFNLKYIEGNFNKSPDVIYLFDAINNIFGYDARDSNFYSFLSFLQLNNLVSSSNGTKTFWLFESPINDDGSLITNKSNERSSLRERAGSKWNDLFKRLYESEYSEMYFSTIDVGDFPDESLNSTLTIEGKIVASTSKEKPNKISGNLILDDCELLSDFRLTVRIKGSITLNKCRQMTGGISIYMEDSTEVSFVRSSLRSIDINALQNSSKQRAIKITDCKTISKVKLSSRGPIVFEIKSSNIGDLETKSECGLKTLLLQSEIKSIEFLEHIENLEINKCTIYNTNVKLYSEINVERIYIDGTFLKGGYFYGQQKTRIRSFYIVASTIEEPFEMRDMILDHTNIGDITLGAPLFFVAVSIESEPVVGRIDLGKVESPVARRIQEGLRPLRVRAAEFGFNSSSVNFQRMETSYLLSQFPRRAFWTGEMPVAAAYKWLSDHGSSMTRPLLAILALFVGYLLLGNVTGVIMAGTISFSPADIFSSFTCHLQNFTNATPLGLFIEGPCKRYPSANVIRSSGLNLFFGAFSYVLFFLFFLAVKRRYQIS